MAVKPIPDGYHTLTPYLSVRGASDALAFYQRAFGASELFRMPAPGGKIGHAEMQIGSSRFMLADENEQTGSKSPQHYNGSPVGLMLYVEDVDAVVKRAVEAGGKLERPVANEFYGDRVGAVVDPFGYRWHIATHVEDVAPEEMQRRMEKMGQPA